MTADIMSSPKACSVPITSPIISVCRGFLFVYRGMGRFKIISEFLAKQIDGSPSLHGGAYWAELRFFVLNFLT